MLTPNKLRHSDRHGGYIVLISVIILSAVLIILAQALSTSGYFQRLGTSKFENKELSYTLSQSCIDKAIFSLSNDLDYGGSETIAVGPYQCTIDPISTQGSNTTITTSASALGSTTKLKMVVNLYLDVISFQEQ